MFFKMAVICHIAFLKLIFEHTGGPICVSMQNFIQIGLTVAETAICEFF